MDTPTPTPAQPSQPAQNQQGPQGRQPFQRGGRGRFGGGGGRRPGGGRGRGGRIAEKSEFDSKPIDIARVTRVTKGGKRFSFRTTVVIGDGKGRVGVGMAKGRDVAQSIQKATNQARKRLVTVLIKDGTIPYQVEAKFSSAQVILKPAKGGVKAGGPVRVVAKLAGITSLTGKLLGRTNNKINIAMATIEALKKLYPPIPRT
ncbi:MAG: 30S ribosomal protein S5 [Candidatus Yanofskybacteria bacterium]|nr:30S ribosomal protein S5 [Candidatus Yanofskybacteria bacterium]